ncbi:hypothetical protein Hanom_Chr11g01029551 [Helianthus anomalus]
MINILIRLWVMGRELGRGLNTNAHLTTSGGLRFGRGPLGRGFSRGVGRGYETDMAGSDWRGGGGGGGGTPRVNPCSHAPNPRLTIPTFLVLTDKLSTKIMEK